jgi:periplasmic protein TonB
MGTWLRILVGIPVAAIITFLLFMLMRNLIIPEKIEIEEAEARAVIEITQQTKDSEIKRNIKRPDKPEDVKAPPPPPRIQPAKSEQPQEGLATTLGKLPDLQPQRVDKNDINFNVADRDEQPLVRIQNYPRRALERGSEGSCNATVDINPDGSTSNIRLSCTDSVFESQARRDIENWKYQPKVVDGQQVGRRNIRAELVYQLAD